MPYDRREPPAGALARGPVKAVDIEAARRDLDEAEWRFARRLGADCARREREVVKRRRAAPAPRS